MAKAIISALSRFPKGAVKTITCDRGSEFACWREIEKALSLRYVFADPMLNFQNLVFHCQLYNIGIEIIHYICSISTTMAVPGSPAWNLYPFSISSFPVALPEFSESKSVKI